MEHRVCILRLEVQNEQNNTEHVTPEAVFSLFTYLHAVKPVRTLNMMYQNLMSSRSCYSYILCLFLCSISLITCQHLNKVLYERLTTSKT